ncbi:hypothetical protein Q4603_19490 [Zobellia galactanivorans]|uniref:Conserved hypothetical lipoprotein n=1 Tax=Zobellia galactanivorans (strain DSM 12802 / CCUG 47099 / CIP 106680 / NCIMB 13871 / Dsij) TaxID=63186 RepID=G0LCF7_ZOBGA|nr:MULTISPECIES: hypothetical protein [Zobellia]MBU3027868.1 hypothetical protein [Zobellia galactanivorans]MDO6810814.1 hypothetical protein [Zobellia galactanivorans]OWW25102.1 hypothetical protein B4Q04_11195 [Zobellia sp. OII3]CAZ96897.1 Conserved hypothetical lipoprotein [Zobellia galactanivorans]
MKKVFSLLSIIAIILVSNCSRIPENDNPVIGIWSDIEVAPASTTAKSQTVRKEWIFNDAYLGRYHRKINGSITFKTDFKWSYENDKYIISYPGTDMEDQVLSMKSSEEGNTLADAIGNVIAVRE